MKIRLEGTQPELDAAVEQLRLIFPVVSVSRPYRNRNSALYRVYIETQAAGSQRGLTLTPGHQGKNCIGNGEHDGVECQCDECDYAMLCFSGCPE